MRLAVIIMLAMGGTVLSARSRVIPTIEIRVEGSPVMETRVRLMSRKAFSMSYKQLDEGVTDSKGYLQFETRTIKKIGWLALEFTWTPPGKPARTLFYEIRSKKDGKIGRYYKLKFGDTRSWYVLEDSTGGDCTNLFAHQLEESLKITLDRPGAYSECGGKLTDPGLIGQRNINKGKLNYYKFEDDLRMGQEFALQLGKSGENPSLKDPMVNRYINNLVKRIGKASDMPDLEFKVKVIDADVLNAFAVPGGYIWVYRGLIANTETEAELAGVIAHEIAHVTSRHGTEGVTSAINKTALGMAAGMVAEEAAKEQSDMVKQAIQMVVGGGTQYWIVGGTRKREAEADMLGAQYAWKAGYDPSGIATLFHRWSQKKGKQSRLDQLFSDHPTDEERVAAVMRDVGYFLPDTENLIVSGPEYKAVKRRLAKLPPPKKPGEAAGNALFATFTKVNQQILDREITTYMDDEKKSEQQ